MASNVERSLNWFRKQKILVEKVERYVHIPSRKFGVRKDLFGIVDLVALSGQHLIGVQVTSYANLSNHKKKCREAPAMLPWLRTGSLFLLQAWRKPKYRWQLRIFSPYMSDSKLEWYEYDDGIDMAGIVEADFARGLPGWQDIKLAKKLGFGIDET